MASSSSPLVTWVGLRVLEQGGNAVDAAVAMAGMLRINRDGSGRCTSLEAGVDHRLDGVALGF